ncbi:stage IV sporulation protein A [Solibacillus sp. MA9]|uniref:Stage IV sporulation protein A n=1 Tax=Solibacillus palustris TaxID=2908203 RepID=A0ABS9UAS5_9BACL|nr:stage IV sporulation protein A [Solibacillus sp. MA9]
MSEQIFQQLAQRTNGDLYIGVVGPVRVGKSTFVKKVMENVILPNIDNAEDRMRAMDELPQSSPGPVIMTSEPKFVPAQGTTVTFGQSAIPMRVRLVDCVGYVIDGAKGYEDESGPKYVQTPWHNEAIAFQEAAKIGTDKVIRDHANIGIVITADGTVNGMSRAAAQKAEEEIIGQLTDIGKPFVIVLNSNTPNSMEAQTIRNQLAEKYEVPVIATSITNMQLEDIMHVLEEALFEFPVKEIQVEKPDWLDVLDNEHEINETLSFASAQLQDDFMKIRDVEEASAILQQIDFVESCSVESIDPGLGVATLRVTLYNDIYKDVCKQWLEKPVDSKKDWLLFIKEASEAKSAQQRFRNAIEEAKGSGYGVTLPMMDEFDPSEPELISQNNFYGVRMKAVAPSYHIIRIDMEAEFAPLIGSEFHSQHLLKDLQHAYSYDRNALWQTQLFGTPLHEVLTESIRYKMKGVPEHAKNRMRLMLERMINEGERGLITFII